MTTNSETIYIQNCLNLIETKLDWGKREDWKNYDFEKLSDLIFEQTSITLSISTLKRLFGKVSYNNLPALQTLNTLAQFAGFEDWRVFKQQQRTLKEEHKEDHKKDHIEEKQSGRDQAPGEDPETRIESVKAVKVEKAVKAVKAEKKKLMATTWSLFFLIPVTLLSYSLLRNKNADSAILATVKTSGSRFSFSANKIKGEGVPNSVIFTYNASAAATDSVFIVQSWDLRRRTAVPRNKTTFSSIYYYPGFFKAKLMVDSQIVQTHDLMITSDGWLALAETDPVPVYFQKTEYTKNNRVEIDAPLLEKYHLPLYPQASPVRFFYMKDMGGLKDDRFTFETTLKTSFIRGAGACQYVKVLIQCKNDIIIIPLAAKACIGNLSLYAAGTAVNSKNSDLSGFGCDLTHWTRLKVEGKGRQMDFFVNGIKAASLNFPNEPAGIVGVQYQFDGLGAVKDTRFSDGEKLVFNF